MALTANVEIQSKQGLIAALLMDAQKIFKGALVKIAADGYAMNCAAEAGAVFGGIAMELVDNSAGSAGDKVINVERRGIFLLTATGMAQSDVGNKCYASSENLVSNTQAANEQEIGTVVEFVSATKVWVAINL